MQILKKLEVWYSRAEEPESVEVICIRDVYIIKVSNCFASVAIKAIPEARSPYCALEDLIFEKERFGSESVNDYIGTTNAKPRF